MRDRIQTKFIVLISVVALVVTGLSTVPARADNREAAQWIAGIAAVAIIGAAIADANKKKKRERRQRAYDYGHGVQGNRGHAYGHRKGWSDKHGHARPLPQEVRRKLLPGRCLVRGETRRGAVRGFGRHCLNRHYAYTNSLPERCAVRALNRNGEYRRVIYRQRCLGKYGYEVARR